MIYNYLDSWYFCTGWAMVVVPLSSAVFAKYDWKTISNIGYSESETKLLSILLGVSSLLHLCKMVAKRTMY